MFLVSSGVCQLLSWATKTKTVRKEANMQKAKARNRRQRAHCKWAL